MRSSPWLAAAGAVTERIGLLTNVLIAPARSTAELAKQASTVQLISDGRLTLGIGVGWRESDYLLTGRDFHSRGKLFDAQLTDLERAWSGEALADETRPAVPAGHGVPLLIGGTSDATVRRIVEHGAGWTAGGAPPDAIGAFAGQVRKAWHEAGREGEPKIAGLTYFGLGDTQDASRAYLLDYYKFMGSDTAEMIAGSALRSADAITGARHAFEGAGLSAWVLVPTVSDPDQVDRLAEVVFG